MGVSPTHVVLFAAASDRDDVPHGGRDSRDENSASSKSGETLVLGEEPANTVSTVERYSSVMLFQVEVQQT